MIQDTNQAVETNILLQFVEVSGFLPQSHGSSFQLCVDINGKPMAETPLAQCDITGKLVWKSPGANIIEMAACPLPSTPRAPLPSRVTMVIRVMASDPSQTSIASIALDLVYQGDKKKRANLPLPGIQSLNMSLIIQQQRTLLPKRTMAPTTSTYVPNSEPTHSVPLPPLPLPLPSLESSAPRVSSTFLQLNHGDMILRQTGAQVCDRIYDGQKQCETLRKESLMLRTACVSLQQDFDDYSAEVDEAHDRIAKLRADLERSRTVAQEMKQLRLEINSARQDAKTRGKITCSVCSVM